MTGPGRWQRWGDDQGKREDELRELEQRLRRALAGHEPVPPSVVERARAAGREREPRGSVLVELVYDSIDDIDLVEVGAGDRTRLLEFSGDIRVVVRLDIVVGEIRLAAWTAPKRATSIQLATEHATRDLIAEPDGTMVARSVARTVSRLVIATDRGGPRAYHTSWFVP